MCPALGSYFDIRASFFPLVLLVQDLFPPLARLHSVLRMVAHLFLLFHWHKSSSSLSFYFFLPLSASAAFFVAAASAFCLALKAKSSSVISLAAFLGAFKGLALPPSRPGCVGCDECGDGGEWGVPSPVGRDRAAGERRGAWVFWQICKNRQATYHE